MHFVDCGAEPPSLEKLRNPQLDWDKAATSPEYGPFMEAFSEKFNQLCGYCERVCTKESAPNSDDHPSVDHFRPKGVPCYRHLTFMWDNLVYACYRCNQAKKDRFPAGEDLRAYQGRLDLIRPHSEIKRLVKKFDRPFRPISEKDGYVNPRDGTEPAEKFFAFTAEGEILPAADLPNDPDDPKWSKAVRTIADFELNQWDVAGDASLRGLRATMWSQMKGLMRRNPALAQRVGDLGKAEFPTLVKWVLNHPD